MYIYLIVTLFHWVSLCLLSCVPSLDECPFFAASPSGTGVRSRSPAQVPCRSSVSSCEESNYKEYNIYISRIYISFYLEHVLIIFLNSKFINIHHFMSISPIRSKHENSEWIVGRPRQRLPWGFPSCCEGLARGGTGQVGCPLMSDEKKSKARSKVYGKYC